MTSSPTFWFYKLFQIIAIIGLLALSLPVSAQHSHTTIPDPGYRPDSEYTPAFLEALDTATIAVYPSLVRRAGRTAVSFASQDQIVTALNDNRIITAISRNHRIDLGKLHHGSQWDAFSYGRQHIATALQGQPLDADYRLVMEFLIPGNDQAIFGVHCYIFDQQGRSVFSFLLNSHHQSFVDAKLFTKDSSETARQEVITRATGLGIATLQKQIELARVCGTHTAAQHIVPQDGRIDGFDAGLPTHIDRFGNSLGLMTFTDGPSTVAISTTDVYPSLPSKVTKNKVLQIDMNVTDWAGVLRVFEDFTNKQWVALDLSAFDELSFWFYGNNSGTSMFVDILDNRKPCSTVDDAERYVYTFTDNFSGWERVNVPFAEMVRKEIGNNAPNDGLNLSAVHGWAIGALNTGGPMTFYVEDVAVMRTPPRNVDYPINERPMFGGLKKTAAQKRADKQYIKIATRGGRSHKEAADYAAKTGWNIYYKGDRSTAIKRFNQAWLLDPNNQYALWGFAVISADRRQFEEAVKFFREAIANGPKNPSLERDYEFAQKQLGKLEGHNDARQTGPDQ